MNTKRTGTAALVLVTTLIAPTANAAIGELDTRFGVAGTVTVAGNSGPHLLELPDGRILVIGRPVTTPPAPPDSPDIAISRLLANGTPDTSFGTGGTVSVRLPVARPLINAVALQADGSVVMAGSNWNAGGRPFVARVDRNGSLDRSFGTDGFSEPGGGTEPYYSSLIVMPDGEIRASISDWTQDRIDRFASDGRPLGNLSGVIAPARMALQGDGRLIVSGYHRDLRKPVAMRLDSVGQVDPTFGDNGFAILADGHVDNLGIGSSSDRIVLCHGGVVRLTPDGHVDTTFGLNGTGYVAFGSDSVPAFDLCNRVLTTVSGGVVFVGIRHASGLNGVDQLFIAGLTPTGMVDARFGAGSGASEIDLGGVRSDQYFWNDHSAFIATRDGAALLTWLAPGRSGVTLARIDLGAEAETGAAPPPSVPPTSAPPPAVSPAPTPAPAPISTPSPTIDSGRGGNGGGGAFALFDVVLLAFGLGAAALSRRTRASSAHKGRPGLVRR